MRRCVTVAVERVGLKSLIGDCMHGIKDIESIIKLVKTIEKKFNVEFVKIEKVRSGDDAPISIQFLKGNLDINIVLNSNRVARLHLCTGLYMGNIVCEFYARNVKLNELDRYLDKMLEYYQKLKPEKFSENQKT